MISKKILSSVLALSIMSFAGATFAAETAAKPEAKATAKHHMTYSQECTKEFGKDKAKVKHCIEAKKKAAAHRREEWKKKEAAKKEAAKKKAEMKKEEAKPAAAPAK